MKLALGRRRSAALILAVVSTVMTTMPEAGSAHVPPLIETSVDTGWATPTDTERPDQLTPDPTDPASQRADGRVTLITSRWGSTLCSGAGAAASTIEVFDVEGEPVPGVVSFEAHAGRPDRIMRIDFDEPLTSVRAPYEAVFSAVHHEAGGSPSCDPADVTKHARIFGLDRMIPHGPTLTMSPEPTVVRAEGTKARLDVLVNAGLGDITIQGVASDRLTFPDDDRVETSGIKTAVLILYQAASSSRARPRRVAAFTFRNPCNGTVGDGGPSDALPGCDVSLPFEQVIPRSSLRSGQRYFFGAFSYDYAGQTVSKDGEVRSGETRTPTWLYIG